jgi:dinuclear metal center YbgI/SA1388 family protein
MATTVSTVAELVSLMQGIAPLEYAESWDKVGLLAGDSSRALSGPVLLTIDLTERVLREAIEVKARAIIAYHPPIFEPLTKITDATPRQRVILRAIEAGLAIYSPHTALDAIAGGITDWLCEGLSGSTTPGKILGDCRALTPHAHLPQGQRVKIVTFVQTQDVDRVRSALATAGAGTIGEYQLCSFAGDGEGTFVGGPMTKPTVGNAGQLEHVREARLEMVCGKTNLALAMEMLRRFHPYEQPAIDVYELAPQPVRSVGAGRRLVLDKPATVRDLAQRLKTYIGRDRVRFALAGEEDVPVSRIGVVPGGGSELSRVARQEGCELFVTGEMRHHDVMGALNAGMSVLLGGHTGTERGYLPRLAAMMKERAPALDVRVSAMDREILVNV